MTKCLANADIGTCQNYDHIRAAKVAVQILLGQGAFRRIPLEESLFTNTMLFSPGFVWVFFEKLP